MVNRLNTNGDSENTRPPDPLIYRRIDDMAFPLLNVVEYTLITDVNGYWKFDSSFIAIQSA